MVRFQTCRSSCLVSAREGDFQCAIGDPRNHFAFKPKSITIMGHTWSSFISSVSRRNGKSRISSSRVSTLLTLASALATAGWSAGVRCPNSLARGLWPPTEGTSADKVLDSRSLGELSGDDCSRRGDLGRLGGLCLTLGVGDNPCPGRILSREARERRAGKSSSDSSNKLYSSGSSTSNIASYRSLEVEPTRASKIGKFLMWRGRLLKRLWAASLLD
jgi:hypothetical protein